MSGPFGSQQWMYSSGFYTHEIDQSLRFNESDFPYLQRTPSSVGNRRTYTYSVWVKRGTSTDYPALFNSRVGSTAPWTLLHINNTDEVRFNTSVDGITQYAILTDAKLRDHSAWYHIVYAVDTTQATDSNRVKIYVNGVQQDVSGTYPPQNFDTAMNLAQTHQIGANLGSASKQNFDGYMAEINFVDGTALDPTSFGETKSGVWIPKKYTGSYGTNGFYLPFKNATIANETDAATITAPFGGTAANGKETDGNFVTSNTSTGSAFTLVHYDLGSAKNIQEYVIKGLSFTGGTSTFQLQYSTDNSSWSAATSFSVTSSSQDFSGSLNASIRYWRIQATAFGTNGTASIDSFQLFSGDIGIDDSGNDNDFSSVHLLPSDILLDSPTNNFATLNPLFLSTGGMTFAEGNLKITGTTSGTNSYTRSTINVPSNSKIYFETVLTNVTGAWQTVGVYSVTSGNAYLQYYSGQAYVAKDNVSQGNLTIPSAGDIIGVALDTSAGTCQFYRNSNTYGSQLTGLTTGEYIIQPQVIGTGTQGIQQYNFGQDSSFAGQKTAQGNTDANGIGDFYYTPPSGYLALCTSNLPDPIAAIDPALDANPQDHFNTVLYTGDGSTLASGGQDVTGVGFDPDIVWLKHRDEANDHHVYDQIRGDNKRLFPNGIDLESTGGRLSFITDGFNVSDYDNHNKLNGLFVAWNWKAGGTGVSNTDGSLASTVSANQDLGISIVTFTADGTNNYVGTGLSSSAPLDMVIIKRRDSTSDWQVGHRANSLGTNFASHLNLNDTSALSGSSPYYLGTSSTTAGHYLQLAAGSSGVSSSTWVAYCFQEVEGFSKFGSYTGNGSTDGPFVYCGFRPAFVLMKRSDSTGNWVIFDAARNEYNVVNNNLNPDSSSAENVEAPASTHIIDFTSNGFKLKGAGGAVNTSGGTYIFMAFAEMPFKYANAR